MPKRKKESNIRFEDLSARQDSQHTKFNYFTMTPPHNPDMFVYQSGHKSKCEPGWHTRMTTYDHYIIHYVLSGKGTYYAPSGTYPIKAGDLFLINPYESIHYQADFSDPWTYYWVGFNGHDVFQLLKLCGYDDHRLICSYTQDDKLKDIFHAIAYPSFHSIAREYELLGNLYQMFSLLIHTQGHQPVSKSDQYLSLAVQYIQQHHASPSLQVNDIASYVGIDRTYLYRLFNLSFQLSIQDFILNYRLLKAMSLLKYSDNSLRIISFSCGFENQSYFSSIFKKKFMQTPLHYRKSHQMIKE